VNDLGNIHGSPTEVAIIETLNAYQFPDERKKYNRVAEVLFSHESKFMQVEVTVGESNVFYLKGALEVILSKCKYIYRSPAENLPLTEALRTEMTMQEETMSSSQGLRVLAFAFGKSSVEMTFVGLIGMLDPPRMGIGLAISQLSQARIRFAMITGDSCMLL
jgi:P-type Ca2+ transporter type 2C